MGYEYQEWPKTLYRWNEAGEREGATFKCEDDVEAGWVDIAELGAAPVVKAKPAQDGESAVAAGKRLVAAENDNVRLRDSVKLYEDFVKKLREDDNCPDVLKEAIDKLLGEAAEPAKPKAKRAAKA